ncbi:MAG: GH92 family glycosyl hydrolase [Ignavibacteria bacterium]|nr:GH92 family glycosyl hydrolase [Ignavibacteria bacterium]
MKKLFLLLIVLFLFVSISETACQNTSNKKTTQYVNPFIGNGGHGHTYPGASLPFGMVQLSPDTYTEGWDWCSGYHASDNSIMGFSHTHLSGTGAADYGDILLMPTTGKIQIEPGSREKPDEGYRSRFSHENEKAEPGFYSVFLDDYKIHVELTATERCGFHKYIFPKSDSSNIILDIDHGIQDVTRNAKLKIVDSQTIEGFRRSGGWADDHTVYFYAKFSKPFSASGIYNGEKLLLNSKSCDGKIVKSFFTFPTKENESVLVRIGISSTSIKGAKKNLEKEIPDWNFEKIRKSASDKWEKELSKIQVEGKKKDELITFYTALYHTMLAPNIFSDVDGSYMGMDKKIHHAKNFTMYTVFSLWDTFRALHPFLSIIDKKRTNDFINSMLAKYEESGSLPVWELASNETNCMIGYHAVPVIVDAFMKGIKNYDILKIYQAMKTSAMQNFRGLDYYKIIGFVPMDKEIESVSKTLEYAYDDWCIAQMANHLGKKDDYDYFLNRAQNYKNVFDHSTKFMRGRNYNGMWKKVFDPAEPFPGGSGEFTEGSSWQYTWFVPQDISSLINLMGSNEKFSTKLDELFRVDSLKDYFVPSDMTGLIGQYAHGNEPSHHVAYLYNYAGDAWKTQSRVRDIMKKMYTANRDGLCGNEDCGQMSAWYIFSAIGFYPVTPGSYVYAIGSPIFDRVVINLENGKKFVVQTKNNTDKNVYIQSALLNNKKYDKSFLNYSDIDNGGVLQFKLSDSPNKNWGKGNGNQPVSEITETIFQPVEQKWSFPPTVISDVRNFSSTKKIDLDCFTKNSEIHFTLDGSQPALSSPLYEKPFFIDKTTTLKARAFNKFLPPSEIMDETFLKVIVRDSSSPFLVHDGTLYPTIALAEKSHRLYSSGGENTLIDGVRGSQNFRDGKWLGFQPNNLDVFIDLGKEVSIKSIQTGFLRNQGSWIFLPELVEYSLSSDGNSFEVISSQKIAASEPNDETEIVYISSGSVDKKGRYLRIFAKNINNLPAWHKGSGDKAFIFIDEIVIEGN